MPYVANVPPRGSIRAMTTIRRRAPNGTGQYTARCGKHGPQKHTARGQCLVCLREYMRDRKAADPTLARARQSWIDMRRRCLNRESEKFPDYGGRGITVFPAWAPSATGFEVFLRDVGRPPTDTHQLERIENDGNYEPGNVRWATRLEQGCNKRNNRVFTHDGVTLHLSEWARRTGLDHSTILGRLARGKTVAEALDPRRDPRGRRPSI